MKDYQHLYRDDSEFHFISKNYFPKLTANLMMCMAPSFDFPGQADEIALTPAIFWEEC